MTPEQFYAQYLPYAQSVSQRTGLDPRLVLAQSALETGYGKSAPNMNFFGIKSHGRKGGSTLGTQEFEGGRMVQQPASFRGYETPEQSFADYGDFITSNPRYKGVLGADGLEAQIDAMAKSGYATDPDYGSKLASIASRFDPNSPKVIAAQTMSLLGKAPQTSTKGPQMMQQEQKPRGLLGSLGIQKMEEGAEGETGQRFYQRDSFKDTAAILAQGFGRMGIMGMEEIADDIAKQRTENKARNKTLEYLAQMPNGEELVKLAEVMGPAAVAKQVLAQRLGKGSEDPAEIRTLKYRAEAAGLTLGTPEYQKFMLTGGASEGGSGPAAYEALRLRARDAGLDPNTPEYQQFMRTGGTGDTVASQEKSEETKRLNQKQEDLAFFAAGERVLDRIKEKALVPATGVVADLVKDTPFGQRQLDVAEDLEMMEAQMQFKTLANLKASSPNGSSGLGQLTEAERKALGKLYANFSNRQSEPAVERTIKSSLLLRSYFKNGLYDSTLPTPGQRNATPEELDQMLQGVNPFEGSDGVQLKGVKSFNTAPPASGESQKTKTGVAFRVIY